MSQARRDAIETSATWKSFIRAFGLDNRAQERFLHYIHLLCEWNRKFNITRIVRIDDIIRYHLSDALMLTRCITISDYHALCDIGSGGGIPGLAIAIMHEYMPVTLLEVNLKRVSFLRMVIDRLELSAVSVDTRDFRTFIRLYNGSEIDLVVARASLAPNELIRIFKPSSALRNATLVYFASDAWQAPESVIDYITEQLPYTVGEKKRKYIIMRKQ